MITKHEVLNFVAYNSPFIIDDIANNLNADYKCVAQAIIKLRRASMVKFIKNIQNGKKGPPRKLFEVTDLGLKRLKYFDENDCKNENCSCKSQ